MIARPSWSERLRYAAGGRLPRHLEWVFRDLTASGWRLRVVGRVLIQLAPFAVVLAVLPGIDAGARLLLVTLLVGSSLLTVVTVADQLRDRRLRQHSLPVPEEDPPDTFGPYRGTT